MNNTFVFILKITFNKMIRVDISCIFNELSRVSSWYFFVLGLKCLHILNQSVIKYEINK